jgi:hypothetical protein
MLQGVVVIRPSYPPNTKPATARREVDDVASGSSELNKESKPSLPHISKTLAIMFPTNSWSLINGYKLVSFATNIIDDLVIVPQRYGTFTATVSVYSNNYGGSRDTGMAVVR